jgi:hypothetical protein
MFSEWDTSPHAWTYKLAVYDLQIEGLGLLKSSMEPSLSITSRMLKSHLLVHSCGLFVDAVLL